MHTDWESLSPSLPVEIDSFEYIAFSIQFHCKLAQAGCFFWLVHHVLTGEPLCNNMIAVLFNDSKLTFSIGYDFVKYDLDEFINYDFEFARDLTNDSQLHFLFYVVFCCYFRI